MCCVKIGDIKLEMFIPYIWDFKSLKETIQIQGWFILSIILHKIWMYSQHEIY